MRFGWYDIEPEEAAAMGHEQVYRYKWRVWMIGIFGFSISFVTEAIPLTQDTKQ